MHHHDAVFKKQTNKHNKGQKIIIYKRFFYQFKCDSIVRSRQAHQKSTNYTREKDKMINKLDKIRDTSYYRCAFAKWFSSAKGQTNEERAIRHASTANQNNSIQSITTTKSAILQEEEEEWKAEVRDWPMAIVSHTPNNPSHLLEKKKKKKSMNISPYG